MQNSPPRVPPHPWEWPEQPWARLHIDYADPLISNMFLITVDAHSKQGRSQYFQIEGSKFIKSAQHSQAQVGKAISHPI